MSDEAHALRIAERTTGAVERIYADRLASQDLWIQYLQRENDLLRERIDELTAGEPDYEEIERQHLESPPPRGPEWDTNGRTP